MHDHRAMRSSYLAVVLGLACAPLACSSSSDSPSSTTDGGATDTGGAKDSTASDGATDGGKDDPLNCVPPGTKGNELGMGGYCTPGGHQCDTAGPDAGVRICSADVPDTPTHAWFCTYPCAKDEECGTGSYCADDPRGRGCVPLTCKSLAGDAGTDAASGG